MALKLAFFIALAIISINKQVDCQCANLIQQYYQCKYLKMTNSTDPSYLTYGVGPAYVPDASIPNNQLTDTFYKGLNLDKMTFDQAMQLFWNIYNETNNCKSKFCDCVSKSLIDQTTGGTIAFRNATIYPQMKSILLSFINKNKPYMFSYSQYYFYATQNLSTLNQFCMNYDYSWNRMAYYSNTQSCLSMVSNSLTLRAESCDWSFLSLYKNLTYVSTYYRTNLTSCLLTAYNNCTNETKRLFLAASWFDPGLLLNLPSDTKNLSNYLDTIIAGANAFRPKVNYTNIYLYSSTKYVSILMSDKTITFANTAIINPANSTFTILNSTQLRIDCNVNMTNTQMGFRWINFTFISNRSESYNFYLNMSQLYLQKMNSSFSNGTIIKDKNGQNWLQFVYQYFTKPVSQYFYIYDFNSCSSLMISPYSLFFIISEPTLQNANGIVKLRSTGTVIYQK